MKKSIVIILLASSILLSSACSKKPDEELIRENLDQIVSAVKDRKPSNVKDLLTQDFLAQDRMGPKEVHRFMVAQFFRNQKINILVTGLKVEIEGNTARVNFRAVMTGSLNWLPERLDYYQLKTRWQKQNGDWLIQSAHWSPVMASG